MAMKNDPLAVDADNQSLVGECATVTGLFPHNLQTGALYFGPIFDVDTRHHGNSHADIPVMSCYYPTVDLNKLSPPLYSCAEDEELPLNTHTVGPCSSSTLQSRYLQVVHGIFSDVANYALEGRSSATSIQRAFVVAGEDGFIEDDGGDEAQLVQSLPKWGREARKSQLLGLLQLVDDQYSCWVDEIHTVVSAFHAATELDPRIHARFALQTLSFLYKKLKGRISNQIIAIGVRPNSGNEGDIEEMADPWIVQNERAAQHHHPPPVRTRNHHLWRPQRGLPEKSVSVLKAWMFQNFLHPYPKDAEKHVLAVKSGLTRSQVSNWFINARVRLWKPMIEEMYSALNGKEKRLQLEGIDESCSAVLDAVQQRHDDPRSGIC